ncbi:MAG: T9SS type A sorting domain-containing protein [Bacteroidetes bacterium]|nr:T9SS type A sorting domain-containing protein [Bacteroidota bacterium]MBX7129093.1 T9SS type A sorting domain-containing protein [Flavobacteriales bacterium]MCC6542509.1 T9SS type A sorting domain-containing protein [Flavobacteriales bacterium]HMU13884.1 T9SS type A sorting domain-containing protein [Flavobacteriales bacterium]HNA31784.1 T9SS type A sorting domain-containing protein [Flavobacteriales bacterium]
MISTRWWLVLPILVSCTKAGAQTWCPTGAEWWYEHQNFGQAGYVHAAYVGDTLVDGEPAQRLEAYATGYDFWIDMPYYMQYPSVITRQVGGQVSYRHNEAWYTLFDLDAPPGAQWPLAGLGLFDDRTMAVLDTGHFVVDGIMLRWSEVEFIPPFGSWATDTIVERAGYKNVFIEPWRSLMLEGIVQGLRCYADDGIAYSTGLTATCDLILSTEEFSAHGSFHVHPNPGSDYLWVKCGSPVRTAEARDLLGRSVWSGRGPQAASQVDTSSWPPGCYLVAAEFGNGTRAVRKWIKQ